MHNPSLCGPGLGQAEIPGLGYTHCPEAEESCKSVSTQKSVTPALLLGGKMHSLDASREDLGLRTVHKDLGVKGRWGIASPAGPPAFPPQGFAS